MGGGGGWVVTRRPARSESHPGVFISGVREEGRSVMVVGAVERNEDEGESGGGERQGTAHRAQYTLALFRASAGGVMIR
jgi:hypothetical protein